MPRYPGTMRHSLALLLAGLLAAAQTGPLDFLNHNRPVADAHNCYPEGGKWRDRMDRALSVGFPLAIEQDLAWYAGRVVVAHDAKHMTGAEPTLRDHFFERVRPIVERALAAGDRTRWPIL